MKENLAAFKQWRKLAKPNKLLFSVQLIVNILDKGAMILLALPAAKVITSITESNYNDAYIFLAAVFLLELAGVVFFHIYYMVSRKSISSIYRNIQDKIFEKILKMKSEELKKTSREKMINIINADIYAVAELSRFIAERLSYFIRVIITITIVMVINYQVGLALLLITIINYFVLDFIDGKKALYLKKRKESKDRMTEEFSEIVDDREVIKNLNSQKMIKTTYFNKVDKYINDIKKKEWMWTSIRDNWFYLFYKFIIMAVSAFLVLLISEGAITLILFLIIVPYMNQIIEQSNMFFQIFADVKNAGISALRINTFLNLKEDEVIDFGNYNNDDVYGNIEFSGVSYNNEDKDDPAFGKLIGANFKIKKGSIALIKGERQSGKRQIFFLLNRMIEPNKGQVTLDGASIYEYDKNVYKSNVNFITYKPEFFNGSIMRNMKMVEDNPDEIYKMCRKIGIHNFIMKLPKGYKTDINKNLNKIPSEKQFLIALARELLIKCEVILIYEFPTGLSEEEIINVKKVLSSLRGEKTIIIFSADKVAEDVSNKIIEIKRGKVESIKNNRKVIY